MKKIALPMIAATLLSACMGTSQSVAVTQNDTLSATCASQHMQTINGLPMRCGPQSVKPYTFQ